MFVSKRTDQEENCGQIAEVIRENPRTGAPKHRQIEVKKQVEEVYLLLRDQRKTWQSRGTEKLLSQKKRERKGGKRSSSVVVST